MAKIVDPDDLSYVVNTTAGGSDEIELQTGAKTVQLLAQGTLSDASPGATSGVTGKCVYSKFKEIWKSDSTLNKHKFPIQMIYEASFVWINGWGPLDAQTRDLFRDAGFKETDGRENACIISLGSMYTSPGDQGYYTNASGLDQTKADFDKTGEINENIQIKGTGGTPDTTDYLKLFLREEQRTFAEYDLLTEQGLAALTYQAYRAPLANADDSLKCVDNDTTIGGDAGSVSGVTYSELTIDYLSGQLYETAAVQSYVLDDVVQDTAGRWAICTTAGTMDAAGVAAYASNGGTAVFAAFAGERQIGTNYYAFNRILDVEDAGSTKARLTEIHSWAQYKLRQAADINDDVNGDAWGTVYGNIAPTFTRFIGDTLHTMPGVFIDGYDNNDKNNMRFWDITADGGGVDATTLVPVEGGSTERQFPFTAAGNLNFNEAITDEVDNTTRYTMYFQYITSTTMSALKVTGASGSTATLDWTGADAGLLDHLSNGDYLIISGFTTETDNNGQWQLTGAPSSNTAAAQKVDGVNPVTEATGDAATVLQNPFETPGAVIVDDNGGTDIDGEVTGATIGWDFDYTNNVQGGRTGNVDAPVIVVAIAHDGAQYLTVEHTITESTGQNIAVNCQDELNYENP